MSYVTGTAHYNLPQTVGTDKRDWSDTNKAFADVDAALYGATNDLSDVTSRTEVLEGENVTNKQDIAKNTSDITSLEGRMTAVEHVANDANNGLADVRQDAQDMITSYNETSATSKHDYEVGQFFIYNDVLYKATQKITAGNTIIPNTNCSATNVTTAFGSHIIPVSGTGDSLGKSILAAVNAAYNEDPTNLLHLHYVFASKEIAMKLADISYSFNQVFTVHFASTYVGEFTTGHTNVEMSYLDYSNGGQLKSHFLQLSLNVGETGGTASEINLSNIGRETPEDGFIVY